MALCTCCEDCHEDFMGLVERVRQIDPDAAEWLLNPTIRCHKDKDLSTLFQWDCSPQGHSYWSRIYDELCSN